jgi:hypothetical protein
MAAPNLNTFLSKLLAQVQAAEDVIFAVFKSRLLGFATGESLDIYGRVVGEQRLGRSDDAFRTAIRLRIFVNSCKGTPEEIIYIAEALTGYQGAIPIDVPQSSGAGGNYRVVIPGWPGDDGTVLAFLQSVSPAGVRILGVTASATLYSFKMGDRMGTRLRHT